MSAVFMGASILDWTSSLGRNGQGGQLTVTLVEDPAQGDVFTPPTPGTPVYFSYGTWTFNGIFVNYIQKSGQDGFIYEVNLGDPSEIIQNAQVILAGYTGTPTIKNLLNVYGYWENQGFGRSELNDNGMPLTLVKEAITEMLNGNSEYGSPLEFLGYRYRLDLSNLPNTSQYYRVSGPVIGLLELIDQVCTDNNCDYFFRLNVINGYNYIVLHVISKNTNPPTGLITRFLNQTDGAIATTAGLELRNQTTCKMLVGSNIEALNIQYSNLYNNGVNTQIIDYSSQRTNLEHPFNSYIQGVIDDPNILAIPIHSYRFGLCVGNKKVISEIVDANIMPYWGTFDSGYQYIPTYAYEEQDFLTFLSLSSTKCDISTQNNPRANYIRQGGQSYPPLYGWIRNQNKLNEHVFYTCGKSIINAFAMYHDAAIFKSVIAGYNEWIGLGELKAALVSQDSWEDYINSRSDLLKTIANNNHSGAANTVFVATDVYARNGKTTTPNRTFNVQSRALNYKLSGAGIDYSVVSDILAGKDISKQAAQKLNNINIGAADDRYNPDRIKAEKIYQHINNIASECYGRKFIVKPQEIISAKLNSELIPIYSHDPNGEGYYEGSILNVNTFEQLFFRTEDGKLQTFVEFDSVNFIDITKLNDSDYIITVQTDDLPDLEKASRNKYGNNTLDDVFTMWTNATLPISTRLYLKCNVEIKPVFGTFTLMLQSLGAEEDYFAYDDIRLVITLPSPVYFRPEVTIDGRRSVDELDITSAAKNGYIGAPRNDFPSRIVSEGTTLQSRGQLAIGRPITNLEKNSINDFTRSTATKMLNVDEVPEVLIPRAVVYGLKYNNQRYGPWTAAGAAGKVEFEEDTSLNPWTFNGYENMNRAAQARIDGIASTMLFAETGSIETPGLPSLFVGDQLLPGGPLVTDVRVNIGQNGITTTYTMGAFNQSNRLGYYEYERLKQRFVRPKVLNEPVIQKIFENKPIAQPKDIRKFDVKIGTPHDVMVGKVHSVGSGIQRTVASETLVEFKAEINSDYQNNAGISMDGLFTPFSTTRHEKLPYFSSGVISSNLFPYPSGHDIALIVQGSSLPPNLLNNMDSGNDYRSFGFKFPAVGVGFGLDTTGSPVPGNGSGGYSPDYLNPSNWKAGPIDLRWDEARGVWTGGGGTNVYRGLAQENIGPYGTGSGLIYASETQRVRFESWLGQPVCSGQRLIVFQDATSTSGTYYIQQAEFSPIGIVTNLVCGSGSNELIMSRRNFYFPGGFSGADTSVLNS